MKKSNTAISGWIFPIVLYFIVPEIGGVFLIIKIVVSVLKAVNKTSSNRNPQFTNPESQTNEIIPHDIDFSHDHNPYTVNESTITNKPSKVFETEMDIRCPSCNASNYVKKLPSTCEYCGNQIRKI